MFLLAQSDLSVPTWAPNLLVKYAQIPLGANSYHTALLFVHSYFEVMSLTLQYCKSKYCWYNRSSTHIYFLFPELPVCSPLLQALLRTLVQWEEVSAARLALFNGPPEDYIPGCYKDSSHSVPPALKYKAMMEPGNTPFLWVQQCNMDDKDMVLGCQ